MSGESASVPFRQLVDDNGEQFLQELEVARQAGLVCRCLFEAVVKIEAASKPKRKLGKVRGKQRIAAEPMHQSATRTPALEVDDGSDVGARSGVVEKQAEFIEVAIVQSGEYCHQIGGNCRTTALFARVVGGTAKHTRS